MLVPSKLRVAKASARPNFGTAVLFAAPSPEADVPFEVTVSATATKAANFLLNI
jgi:hypothetical protein